MGKATNQSLYAKTLGAILIVVGLALKGLGYLPGIGMWDMILGVVTAVALYSTVDINIFMDKIVQMKSMVVNASKPDDSKSE